MPSLNVLDAIGNTPLVQLLHVVPAGSARVVAKLESTNPTGSMKDRMALALIERAAADGRVSPGGTVVEYTSGTTGISLAVVCAALGYHAHFVSSDAFSDEKRLTMRAYGAKVTEVPSDNKKITEQLIKTLIRTAEEIGRQAGHWSCDQLNNRDGEAGYHPLGEELWQQTGQRVDAFVHAVGTAHSIHGTATRCGATTHRCASTPSNPPSQRCSLANHPEPTRSKGSASASFHPCGSPTKSRRFSR